MILRCNKTILCTHDLPNSIKCVASPDVKVDDNIPMRFPISLHDKHFGIRSRAARKSVERLLHYYFTIQTQIIPDTTHFEVGDLLIQKCTFKVADLPDKTGENSTPDTINDLTQGSLPVRSALQKQSVGVKRQYDRRYEKADKDPNFPG